MTISYPIILTPDVPGYIVYIPDFDISTEGDDLMEALYMAKDAIELMLTDFTNDGKAIPLPLRPFR